jgi:hypothetical protein
MLSEQGGVCYVCKKEDRRRLCVDHDHRTGAVRKLLCDSCNNLLGRCDDDIEILAKLISYVEEHRSV